MLNKHRSLVGFCILMAGVLLVNCIGLVTDLRVITGSPVWLKPAKFAISTAIYAGTLAWILNQITLWPNFIKRMGRITAAMLMIEIAVINLQAWRGTTSHFNFQTNLDSSLFGIMGASIAVLWLASVGVAVALFKQEFQNASLGWALRFGMLITVLGSASGAMMTHPMPGQTSGIYGSHTVGAPDGGRGLPVAGWSADHGDLRIAHFVGLHGMQAIPFFYWLLARRRHPSSSTIFFIAGSYLFAAVLLEWQALRGQSILQPDSTTLYAWLGWLAFTVISLARSSACEHQLHSQANLA